MKKAIHARALGAAFVTMVWYLGVSLCILLDAKFPGISLAAELLNFIFFAVLCSLFALYLTDNKTKRVGSFFLVLLFAPLLSSMTSDLIFLPTAKTAKVSDLSSPGYTITSTNVKVDNTDMRTVMDVAMKRSPDVMAFIEVGQYQATELDKVVPKDYPHRYKSKTEGPFGILVYSKQPIENAKFENDTFADEPHFEGEIQFGSEKVNFAVVHPMIPLRHQDLLKRDQRIVKLVTEKSQPDAKVVVVGDFNATRTSTLFRDLKNLGRGLVVAPAHGFKISLKPYMLLVDHVVFSGDSIGLRASGHDLVEGSDHKMAWAQFNTGK